MKSQPAEQRHEVERQIKRLERQSENHQLRKFEALLKAKIQDNQQPPLISNAS